MSPLMQPPLRGYTDEQRVSNFDTGLLTTLNLVNQAGPTSSGVEDVSRYAYLAMSVHNSAGNASLGVTWYADQGGTIQLGQRLFQFSSLVPTDPQIRILNLGPFVNVNMFGNSGTLTSAICKIFATNRSYPLEFIPVNPVVIDQQNVAIGGGSTVTEYPDDYYAGPVQAWVAGPAAASFLNLQWLNAGNSWDLISQSSVPANGGASFFLVTPPGAWRMAVQQIGGAASTFDLAVTPSTTGAT